MTTTTTTTTISMPLTITSATVTLQNSSSYFGHGVFSKNGSHPSVAFLFTSIGLRRLEGIPDFSWGAARAFPGQMTSSGQDDLIKVDQHGKNVAISSRLDVGGLTFHCERFKDDSYHGLVVKDETKF